MNIPSEISKITFNQNTNRYKLVFNEIGNSSRICLIDVVNSDAKNIALAKENISSSRLKTYNLLINILSNISMKIDKVIISKRDKYVISTIHIVKNKKKIIIESNFVDSVILSLKTYSIIYINESLFFDQDNNILFDYEEESIKLNVEKYMSDNAKVERLKKTLNELIENEKYESAAIIRDRILKIANKNKT
tara:strand:- start:73 stop:648 length:576 start_codon:yes stop_codon:yes gene_type:complete